MIALMSALFAVLSHTFAKSMTVHYHPVVIVFFRCFMSLIFISGWAIATGQSSIYKTKRLSQNILRGALGAFSTIAVVWTFASLPLGDASALLNASPLLSVCLAIIILGEKITLKRSAILGVGFIGVVIMAQPTGQIPIKGVMIGLGAATSIALITVLIRHLGKTESALTMTFYFSLVGTLVSGALAPFFWTGWDKNLMWAVPLVGFFGMLAQITHAQALKHLPISIKEPIGYTFFLWALLFGFIIWGTLPTPIVILGSLLVIISNLTLVFVEIRKNKKERELADFNFS